LTHERDLGQVDAFRLGLEPMLAGGQLLQVLCQFPQRFHFNNANREWLAVMREKLGDLPIAIEFRHHSWDRPDMVDWLRREDITLVSVDVPEIPALYPRKLVQTGRQIYVRFHSRRADLWYAAGHDRYDYAYADSELQPWLDALVDRAEDADRALLVFNNCRHGHAVSSARRAFTLLSQMDFPFRIVAPSVPEVRQGDLF
jgi:uncharacterized protein YecE (DUF72 family)